MEKNRITSFQFFSLMLLFQLGTSLVVNLGMRAGKDAWISILLGMGYGLLLFGIFVFLYKLFPEILPTTYVRKLLGKHVGWVIGLLYTVFFIYQTGRDLRDGGALVLSTALKQTPLIVANALMIMSVAYAIHKGIEVLARTAVIFAVVVVLIGGFSTILLVLSGVIEIERVFPVLGEGLRPVLETFIRQSYAFPFSEIITFSMILPYLGNAKTGVKAGYIAILVSGIILSYTSVINVAVLGVDMVQRSPLPLMTTISKASISDFIQRNDILIVMTLIIDDFFKVAVYFYVALVGTADLFKMDYRKLIYPMALLVLFISLVVAKSLPEHLEEGAIILYRFTPLFFVIIPLILYAAGWIYKIRKASGGGQGADAEQTQSGGQQGDSEQTQSGGQGADAEQAQGGGQGADTEQAQGGGQGADAEQAQGGKQGAGAEQAQSGGQGADAEQAQGDGQEGQQQKPK
ncbi:GerAB/ArcD/ProY family transporter [Paenibacillus sp. YPG26]|uniref:GerAB/ArcD/ProY family transporter n=1 Tax=Paenibacillus sp. YPG26 TaxID=2878915 RepID=UPI0020424DB1|nr:GerAB/ArcD/ProY family transporter [Paenibacillus sp. YPG26]USB32943.1 GerAB/ArcD/ProY family transporter [Paenibacillus sp. YPG26]